MTYNILIATLALFNIAYSKTACGNNWCYSEDVTTTSTSVIIQNGDDNAETTFEVSFTPRDQYCFRPSISFAYEKIDYNSWSETIKLYDNNNAQIAKCGATKGEQNKCPEFTTCLTEQSLGITSIYQDTTYTIKVVESEAVDACCLGPEASCSGAATSPHALTINAKLTLNCDTECDANLLDTQCEYDADCPYCMQCCSKRKVCEFPRQRAESIVNALNEMDDKMDSVSGVFSYKYILLIGVILFVLINNVFIGYWCLRKKSVTQDEEYEKCDINVGVEDEEQISIIQ